MKTVATLADATRLAARTGGALEVGGKVINAGRARLDMVPRTPAPAPPLKEVREPSPAAPARDERLDQLVALVAAQSRASADLMGQVLGKLQAPPPVMTKMRPASFTIVRDTEGRPSALAPTYETGTPSRPVRFDVVLGDDGFAASLIPVY